MDIWRLLKQAFSNSWDKSHMRGGYLWSTVICSTEYEQSDCESTRSFQSVRSYEEVCGASSAWVVFVHRDRSQWRWTATVRHLICVTSGIWDWTTDIVMVIDIATPHWWLKSSEDRSLRSFECSTTCFHSLAKPGLVTFLVAEPGNWLYCCLTDWSIVWMNE